MTFSIKRVYAIFEKDIKDLSKNMFVLTSVLMPIILAIFYGKMDEIPLNMYFIVINTGFTIVGAYVQCVLIAEEKEKNTLRGLMLSPASIAEILGGKSILSFLLTAITIWLCVKLMGYEPANPTYIMIALILSLFFYLALGTMLGLLLRTVMEASVVIVPVFMLFGFGVFIKGLIEKYPILTFMEYLPNIQLEELAMKVETGSGIADSWIHFAIITVWVIVAIILTVIIYRKKEMD